MVLPNILRRSASFVRQFYCRTLSTQSHRNLILPAASVSSLRQFSTSPSPSCKDNDSPLLKEVLSKLESLQRDIESLCKPNADESHVKCEDSLPDNTFLKAIQSEISYTVNLCNLSKKDAIIPEDFPFKIDIDIPGTRSIYLSKEYKDERVEVKVEIPEFSCYNSSNTVPEEKLYKEKKNDKYFYIHPTVGVSSKSKKVEFICCASSDKIDIYSAKHSGDCYEGLHLSDLDENLQKEFHKYLELRGITLTTTNFLYLYMLDKSYRERLRLLQIYEKGLI